MNFSRSQILIGIPAWSSELARCEDHIHSGACGIAIRTQSGNCVPWTETKPAILLACTAPWRLRVHAPDLRDRQGDGNHPCRPAGREQPWPDGGEDAMHGGGHGLGRYDPRAIKACRADDLLRAPAEREREGPGKATHPSPGLFNRPPVATSEADASQSAGALGHHIRNRYRGKGTRERQFETEHRGTCIHRQERRRSGPWAERQRIAISVDPSRNHARRWSVDRHHESDGDTPGGGHSRRAHQP